MILDKTTNTDFVTNKMAFLYHIRVDVAIDHLYPSPPEKYNSIKIPPNRYYEMQY